jgi:hypothetical protein
MPGAALAQTPGDDQYTDPFGGSQDEDSGEEAQPEPTATPVPEAAPAAPAPEAAPEAPPAAQQLPRTGGDAMIPLVSGTILLAGGVVLRLRLRFVQRGAGTSTAAG